MAININVQVIEKLLSLYQPFRYKVLYGGRASGKSIAVVDYLIISSAFNKENILCCREFQSSIKDSVHRTIRDRIDTLQLQEYFHITRDEIRSRCGSIFIFKGLAHNYREIKSTQGITKCFVEEAENVSADSWEVLIPTIREENSEIIISFNPADENNPTYQRFILNKPENSWIQKINYYDNPFLPKVLLQEIEYDKIHNVDRFRHIWEGECLKVSEAIIFKDRYTVQDFYLNQEHGIIYFNNKRIKFLYGLDHGFSRDPLAAIECFINDDILYINNEFYAIGIEIDKIKESILNVMPNIIDNLCYADNARPETNTYLLRQGLNVKSVDKWKGSVEDGIERIKSFKQVIIHPRCKNTIYEFKSYSYKKDKTTGSILNDIIDANNHSIDALRYALNDYIRNKSREFNINLRAG